ncbi:MAG: leucine-rich repeat domain-containing protein, partial [Alistipes sp.]|nr:leucine-rich repeat domain-containing protein [Alistipes sp.]
TFAVINGSSKAVFEQTSGNNFEGTLPEGDSEGEPTYRGIYPASAASDDGCTFTIDLAEQTGALDESKTFMFATSDTGLDYSFQHTTALLRPTFKVGDDALSNAVITKVVVKNTTTARAIPCFAGTQATDTTGDIIINRPTPSADDIYIYMCKPYSGGEKIDVLVYATDNGIDKLYEGSINVPEGKSLTMGNLYTPTVILSEIVPSNTILYYATNKLGLKKFGTEGIDYTHTFADGVGRIIKKDGNWESLPDNAFASSTAGVTKIILPETITKVGVQAFAYINSLEEVIMPGVRTIRSGLGLEPFQNCSSLKRVEIPKIEEISPSTFYGLSALKEVVLPTSGSGYTVGDGAFSYCTNLNNINLSMATSLGNNCFAQCATLENVSLPEAMSLGNSCFSCCTALATVNLPKAESLGDYCFNECTAFKSVIIPEATSLGSYCFNECTLLSTITLPKVVSLGSYCFNECTLLSTITLPKVVSLGSYCFYKCNSLSTVTLPKVVSLGECCFESCADLESVDLPKAESLGLKCFNKCNSLQSVTLGENIATLNGPVFNFCGMLSSVTIKSLTPPTLEGADLFYYCTNLTKIYVPASAVDDYKDAWSDYAHLIEGDIWGDDILDNVIMVMP